MWEQLLKWDFVGFLLTVRLRAQDSVQRAWVADGLGVLGIATHAHRFALLFAAFFRYEIGTLRLLDVRGQLFIK